MSMSADAVKLEKELFDKIRSGSSLQEIVAVLNQGIDVDILDSNLDTPLVCATDWKRKDIVELLVMRGAKIDRKLPYTTFYKSPLFSAVSYNNTELLSFLLQHKAQINVLNGFRFSLLHIAVVQSHAETVRLLLENKADYTLKDKYSATPIKMHGITDEIRQLILDQIDKDKALAKSKDKDSAGEISKPKCYEDFSYGGF